MNTDYQRITRVIHFIDTHRAQQPRLREIARAVHLSESHLHSLFRRWAGIGPKRFLEFLTLDHAKELLAGSRSVLDASLESGLSGPGRLHDLFVSLEAITPGEHRRRGEGLRIAHGFHPTPFGECLIGVTERGVCHLAFVTDSRAHALADLRRRWPKAELIDDKRATLPTVEHIFSRVASSSAPLPLLVAGTNFQVKVWEALLRVHPGSLTTYAALARAIGRPTASRAVGQAVGANPLAYVIPCHRVIRSLGALGGYHWGVERKRVMQAYETARKSE